MNAPFRPHRFACLVHLRLFGQPFGHQEAVTIGQLPCLQSLQVVDPTTGGAFSKSAFEGQVLPAPWSHLTSLGLTRIKDVAEDLDSISMLTTLRSFAWENNVGDLPWCSISSLPFLKCLTVAGLDVDRPPPMADMFALEVLDLKLTGCRRFDCWNILDNMVSNSITKLTCRPGNTFSRPPMYLQNFTALQHLVLTGFRIDSDDNFAFWSRLGLVTWVTKLDVGWLWVHYNHEWGLILQGTLERMMQLASLRVSLRVDSIRPRDVTAALTQILYFLSLQLVCLTDLSIVYKLAPGFNPEAVIARMHKLQSQLQVRFQGAQVQVEHSGSNA
ncbi:hypothetical protein ABBQ38_012364 [Trebouxia sp. C0009 RCD-2024]